MTYAEIVLNARSTLRAQGVNVRVKTNPDFMQDMELTDLMALYVSQEDAEELENRLTHATIASA